MYMFLISLELYLILSFIDFLGMRFHRFKYGNFDIETAIINIFCI